MQNNSQNRQQRSEPKEAPRPPVPDKPFIGIVTDCVKLNVRKAPDPDADVLTIIPCLSKVDVNLAASTDDFCKVRTETGIEGFCMKKYIALRQ